MTKTEAVRQAVEAGITDNKEIAAFAKRMGIEFPENSNAISVIKSTLKKKSEDGVPTTPGQRGRPVGSSNNATVAQSPSQQPVVSPTNGGGSFGHAEAVVAVRNLANQLGGMDKLKELANVLS